MQNIKEKLRHFEIFVVEYFCFLFRIKKEAFESKSNTFGDFLKYQFDFSQLCNLLHEIFKDLFSYKFASKFTIFIPIFNATKML